MKVRVEGGARGMGLEDITRALEKALEAADPVRMVRRRVVRNGNSVRVGRAKLDLDEFGRVMVLGAGKASARMALGVEGVLGDRITAGCVVVPSSQPKPPCKKVGLFGAPHPVPGPESVEGARRILRTLGTPREDDLAICLFSGGGSALMELPAEGVGLDDLEETTRLLLRSGSSIDEVNAVRKHLSQVKGGRLAEKLYPARVLTLLVSDVVGNREDSIASGPTVPDSTTYADAKRVLLRRGLWSRAPLGVRGAIGEGVRGERADTPKAGSRVFDRAVSVMVGDNVGCCRAAAAELEARGYRARLVTTKMSGEARDVGTSFGRRLARKSKRGVGKFALVSGGETTVTVTGGGKGGRNQELALAASLAVRGERGVWLASMGTDGIDGMTDAAGAVVSWRTVGEAKEAGMDPGHFLQENDSNGFFRRAGGLILTGPTGTNVNDVVIGLRVL